MSGEHFKTMGEIIRGEIAPAPTTEGDGFEVIRARIADPASYGNKKRAAVSLIERPKDGRMLVVWNRRYSCWTMPGGMVEEDEDSASAQQRELREETGLWTQDAELIWSMPVDGPDLSRAAICDVWRVVPLSYKGAREVEPSTPVSWFTRDEFLKWCDFREFYRHMWTELAKCAQPKSFSKTCGCPCESCAMEMHHACGYHGGCSLTKAALR